ncbi:MAG: hypothetical protein IJ875_04150 [Solobacterium sp.]|nr:hypothetical protein [Solobacterium sp.]
MNFYIADTHFGHENVIRFDHRPFATIEEHDEGLIQNWNSVVKDEDHVYILGDFCFRNKKPVKEYTSRLKGHLHLIRGNHDKKNPEYESCFESTHDYLSVPDEVFGVKKEIVLCHYWMPFVGIRKIMLYGHTHIGSEYELELRLKEELKRNHYPQNAYNVGCMHLGYYPRTIEEIVKREEIVNLVKPE